MKLDEKPLRLSLYMELVEVLPFLMESNINDDLEWEDDGIEGGILANLEEYIELVQHEIEYDRSDGEFTYASAEDLDTLESTCKQILIRLKREEIMDQQTKDWLQWRLTDLIESVVCLGPDQGKANQVDYGKRWIPGILRELETMLKRKENDVQD
jgi:hypothetical protein